MDSLINFQNETFGAIRGLEIEGKAYFVGKDIANCLGYSNTNDAINRHCKGVVFHEGLKINGIKVALISEGDVYRLIIKSKLPAASKFEKWVMDEVLVQIRKTGGYIPLENNMSDAEIMAKALMVAQNTLNKKDELLKAKDEVIKAKEIELGAKNKFIHQISVSENSLLVREVAKLASKNGFTIGEKTLWKKLREWKLIFKNTTEPMQSGIDRGYFEVVEGSRESSKGVLGYGHD